jgi:hypothetical protein
VGEDKMFLDTAVFTELTALNLSSHLAYIAVTGALTYNGNIFATLDNHLLVPALTLDSNNFIVA